MSIINDFTDAVVADICRKEGVTTGYPIGENTYRFDYLSEESWNRFLTAMDSRIFNQYMSADGGELKSVGKRPPKMASLISSSRMIYMLSKDIQSGDGSHFSFEEKRDTVVGHNANLDGYFCRNDKVFYVEAKCREPYGHALVQKISRNYFGVYSWLRSKMKGVFNCVMEDIDEEMMHVVFLSRGKVVQYFDIKQMICHLLGIAAYHLRQKEEPKPIHFLYLLYDPSALSFPEKSSVKILNIYKKTCNTAIGYHFESIFSSIIDYLVQEEGLPTANVEKLKCNFKFDLCSQNDYEAFFE